MGIVNKVTSPAIVTNYASIMDSMANTFSTTMSNDEITSLIKYQLNKNPNGKLSNLWLMVLEIHKCVQNLEMLLM